MTHDRPVRFRSSIPLPSPPPSLPPARPPSTPPSLPPSFRLTHSLCVCVCDHGGAVHYAQGIAHTVHARACYRLPFRLDVPGRPSVCQHFLQPAENLCLLRRPLPPRPGCGEVTLRLLRRQTRVHTHDTRQARAHRETNRQSGTRARSRVIARV